MNPHGRSGSPFLFRLFLSFSRPVFRRKSFALKVWLNFWVFSIFWKGSCWKRTWKEWQLQGLAFMFQGWPINFLLFSRFLGRFYPFWGAYRGRWTFWACFWTGSIFRIIERWHFFVGRGCCCTCQGACCGLIGFVRWWCLGVRGQAWIGVGLCGFWGLFVFINILPFPWV